MFGYDALWLRMAGFTNMSCFEVFTLLTWYWDTDWTLRRERRERRRRKRWWFRVRLSVLPSWPFIHSSPWTGSLGHVTGPFAVHTFGGQRFTKKFVSDNRIKHPIGPTPDCIQFESCASPPRLKWFSDLISISVFTRKWSVKSQGGLWLRMDLPF